MPSKYNQSVRDKIPKQRFCVINSAKYNEALRKRGDLTIWISDKALNCWRDERRKTPGGQHKYSDLSIEMCLTLPVVFNLPLRQTQGFIRSIMRLLKLEIIVPDYTTLSRRAGQLSISQSRRSTSDPIILIVDSTGLKIKGNSEWSEEKHRAKPRKTWRKLHIGVTQKAVILSVLL